MKHQLLHFALVGFLCAINACEMRSGPVDVEVLVARPQEPQQFQLSTVTLQTAVDVHQGIAERFRIRGGLQVNAQTMMDTLATDDIDRSQMNERALGEGGAVVAPRLQWDGARYVAEDFDTLQYLTLFHLFEQVWRFFDEVVQDRSIATQSPGLIGFYGSVGLADGIPVPVLSHDNAVYLAFLDGWLTFRSADITGGVPFAMNPGVVAHEFQHRVFFHQVFGDAHFSTWKRWILSDGPLTEAGVLLKGVDEGLSDIHAAGFVRSLAFMTPTLVDDLADEALFRDLGGEFAAAVTWEGLATGFGLSRAAERHCGVTRDAGLDAELRYYCLGTLVARTLWDGAGEEFDPLRDQLLPPLNLALSEFGDAVAAESADAGELRVPIEALWRALLRRVEPSIRATLCQALDARWQGAWAPGALSECR